MKKNFLAFIILSMTITLTGCWGMVEINNRIFPYTLGMDTAEDNKYTMTITYPNINGIAGNTQEDTMYAISSTANSMYEGTRELTTRLPYSIYYKHLKVVMFGKEFAKDDMAIRKTLDNLSRDVVINNKIKLIFTEGTSQDFLNKLMTATKQESIEGTLNKMLSNNQNASYFTPQTLTKFIAETELNGSSMMPIAISLEHDIKISGAAVFNQYKYIGQIDGIENRAIAMLNGEMSRDVIYAPYRDVGISFLVSNSKVDKDFKNENGKLKLSLEIAVSGALQEYILEDEEYIRLNDEILKAMEESVEKVLKEESESIINKMQKELKADLIHVGEYLYKYEPKLWNQVKEKWPEAFEDMDINVEVKAYIRRIGLTY